MNSEVYNRYLAGMKKMHRLSPDWMNSPTFITIPKYIKDDNSVCFSGLIELSQIVYAKIASLQEIEDVALIRNPIKISFRRVDRVSFQALDFVIKVLADTLSIRNNIDISRLPEPVPDFLQQIQKDLMADECYRDSLDDPSDRPKTYKDLLYYPVFQESLFNFWKNVAEDGCVYLQNSLGVCYYEGLFVNQDHYAAVYFWELAALEKNPCALYHLGNSCHEGNGKEYFPDTARSYYKKSAELGYAPAMYALGEEYFYGFGLPRDEKIAIEYFKEAAELGDDKALSVLGECYSDGYLVPLDPEKAVSLWKLAAERGNADAQYNLGLCYLTGKVVVQCPPKAVEYIAEAAKSDHPEAQFKLGCCYMYGYVVKPNIKEAIKWWKFASYKDNADAQYNLGLCYEAGYGVEQDDKRAADEYYKSAVNCNPDGAYRYAFCSYYGKGTPKDHHTTILWLNMSAENNNPDACGFLGYCYEHGKGVDKDLLKALEWYRKAVDLGNADAVKSLNRLEKKQKKR